MENITNIQTEMSRKIDAMLAQSLNQIYESSAKMAKARKAMEKAYVDNGYTDEQAYEIVSEIIKG